MIGSKRNFSVCFRGKAECFQKKDYVRISVVTLSRVQDSFQGCFIYLELWSFNEFQTKYIRPDVTGAGPETAMSKIFEMLQF